MSGDNFQIDHHKVKAISADLQNNVMRQIKINLRTLDDAMQQLNHSWGGNKSAKFQQGYAQWQADSAKLAPTLQSYSDKLQATANQFGQADLG